MKNGKSNFNSFLGTLLVAILALIAFSIFSKSKDKEQQDLTPLSSQTTDEIKKDSGETEPSKLDTDNTLESQPLDPPIVLEGSSNDLPADLAEQLERVPPDLPEDLKKQLQSPTPELPEDMKAQLNAPPPPLPEDIQRALQEPPRPVTAEEVNDPNWKPDF